MVEACPELAEIRPELELEESAVPSATETWTLPHDGERDHEIQRLILAARIRQLGRTQWLIDSGKVGGEALVRAQQLAARLARYDEKRASKLP